MLDHETRVFPELLEVVLSLKALDLKRLLSLRVQGRDDELLQDVTFVVKGLQERLQGFKRQSLPLGMQVRSDQVNKVVQYRLDLKASLIESLLVLTLPNGYPFELSCEYH